jgi:hypothetical protein
MKPLRHHRHSRAATNPTAPRHLKESPLVFPAIRAMESNPGAKDLFGINAYLGVTPMNPKKSDRHPELNDADCLHLAYAVLHPQGPSRGNPQAMVGLLTALNQSFAIRKTDTWSEQDAIMGFILLNAVYPDLIPPKRHILVIGGNHPADLASGLKFYQDVFVAPEKSGHP